MPTLDLLQSAAIFSKGIPSNLLEESPEGGTATDPKYLVPHSGVYI